MHVIKLNGYNATTENGEKLELGTFDSYGEEQLRAGMPHYNKKR